MIMSQTSHLMAHTENKNIYTVMNDMLDLIYSNWPQNSRHPKPLLNCPERCGDQGPGSSSPTTVHCCALPLVRKRLVEMTARVSVLWVLHDFNSSLFNLWTVSTIRKLSDSVWAHSYFPDLLFTAQIRTPQQLCKDMIVPKAHPSILPPQHWDCPPHLHILCTKEKPVLRKAETGAYINNASKMRTLSRQTGPPE